MKIPTPLFPFIIFLFFATSLSAQEGSTTKIAVKGSNTKVRSSPSGTPTAKSNQEKSEIKSTTSYQHPVGNEKDRGENDAERLKNKAAYEKTIPKSK
ncbi:MAG: hypothetical protein M3R27_12060 [Bacteroidota bacterium]|nr:hypothetical protein [Bacteroidota bacterium]